jgi:MFS family permease
VSAAGSLGVLIAGQLVFGVGMGAAFVCAQIAALDGAADADSGLAAGVVDTSFSIGTALGIAVCTSVAAAVAGAARPAGHLGDAGLVLGEQVAFGVAGGFAVLGLLAALVLLPRGSVGGAPSFNVDSESGRRADPVESPCR